MKIPTRLLVSLALVALCIGSTGCNAPGWEPGRKAPEAERVSVPLPGLGVTEFSGERDTTLIITGMTWEPGAAGPGMESLTLERSASGPLGTRAAAQVAVEGQRIAAVERALDRIERRIDQFMPALLGAANASLLPSAVPAQPNTMDQLKAAIVAAVDAAIARRFPATAPVAPPQ